MFRNKQLCFRSKITFLALYKFFLNEKVSKNKNTVKRKAFSKKLHRALYIIEIVIFICLFFLNLPNKHLTYYVTKLLLRHGNAEANQAISLNIFDKKIYTVEKQNVYFILNTLYFKCSLLMYYFYKTEFVFLNNMQFSDSFRH